MKVYLVTETTFYVENGIDRQKANFGETPSIYTAKYKAEKDFYERIAKHGGKITEVSMFPFTTWEHKYEIAGYKYRTIYAILETETY